MTTSAAIAKSSPYSNQKACNHHSHYIQILLSLLGAIIELYFYFIILFDLVPSSVVEDSWYEYEACEEAVFPEKSILFVIFD